MFTTFFSTCRGLEDVVVYLGAYSILVTFLLAYVGGKAAGSRKL